MVHLVNFATDTGITPLVAATFISLIGAVSIAGRLTIGLGAERIGINNTLILTRVFLVISFIILIFTRSTGCFIFLPWCSALLMAEKYRKYLYL